MKVKMDAKQKKITLIASGSDKKVLTLISAFANKAVIEGKKSFLTKITFGYTNKLVLDMKDEAISKEFIQLLLRMK